MVFSSSSTPLCSSLTTTIPRNSLCKTSSLFHHHSLNHRRDEFLQYPNGISSKNHLRRTKKFTPCSKTESGVERKSSSEVDCVGTGLDVECVVNPSEEFSKDSKFRFQGDEGVEWLGTILEWGLLISPFFFWGTAMVAMKEVLPKTGPFFVSSFRLIPAGLMLVAFAASRVGVSPLDSMLGSLLHSSLQLMLLVFRYLSCTISSIPVLPMLVGVSFQSSAQFFSLGHHSFSLDLYDGQGFLAEGLQRTSAGLGSVR